LHIKLAGDGAQLIRADPAGKRVHDFTPGPEAVLRVATTLRESGHGALEGMGMQIGNARQHPAPQRLARLRVVVGADIEQGAGQIATAVDLEAHIAMPALVQPGVFGVKVSRAHANAPLEGIPIIRTQPSTRYLPETL